MPAPVAPKHRNRVLEAIAVYKLIKVVLLLGAAAAAWRLVNPDMAAALRAWAAELPLGYPAHLLREALVWVSGVPVHRWQQVRFVSVAYAALFTAEGIGLWRERAWAEYLTIATTLSFLPFEVVEVLRRTSALRIAVLVSNIAVAIYLIICVRRQRHAPPAPAE